MGLIMDKVPFKTSVYYAGYALPAPHPVHYLLPLTTSCPLQIVVIYPDLSHPFLPLFKVLICRSFIGKRTNIGFHLESLKENEWITPMFVSEWPNGYPSLDHKAVVIGHKCALTPWLSPFKGPLHCATMHSLYPLLPVHPLHLQPSPFSPLFSWLFQSFKWHK